MHLGKRFKNNIYMEILQLWREALTDVLENSSQIRKDLPPEFFINKQELKQVNNFRPVVG